MTSPFKFCALVAVLFTSSNLAQASPLNGTITIDGGFGAIIPIVLQSSAISLISRGSIIVLGGTESFASLTFPDSVSFASDFVFDAGIPTGSEPLFTFTSGVTTDTFYVSRVQTEPNGSFIFYGPLGDGNPTDAAQGYVTLTPNNAEKGSFSVALQIAPAPEPSGLLLLGTGLTCAAGLLFHKRKKLADNDQPTP